MVANLTNRMQLLYFLRLGNKLKDVIEAFAEISSSEGAYNDNFPVRGGIFAESDNLECKEAQLGKERDLHLDRTGPRRFQ